MSEWWSEVGSRLEPSLGKRTKTFLYSGTGRAGGEEEERCPFQRLGMAFVRSCALLRPSGPIIYGLSVVINPAISCCWCARSWETAGGRKKAKAAAWLSAPRQLRLQAPFLPSSPTATTNHCLFHHYASLRPLITASATLSPLHSRDQTSAYATARVLAPSEAWESNRGKCFEEERGEIGNICDGKSGRLSWGVKEGENGRKGRVRI